jgi:uncharacterized membrane protein YedE/YeeE
LSILYLMEILYKPWPWYVAGPLIGIAVPILLLLGNKKLGISSTLTQICAACIPSNITSLKYDWRKDSWNLLFVAGVFLGGFLGGYVFANPNPVELSASTIEFFKSHGLAHPQGLMPQELFNWASLFSIKGFLLMIAGGFMVGFGTRYARGCTSGHGILGLSALQWPSLAATASFFLGGILFCRFVLPYILDLH